MELKIGEEYEKIVPKLKPEEYEALKQSLEKEGQLYPIIVNSQGTILDGMHRFRILGEKTKYEVKDFPDKESEKTFVITVNLKRRHLNDFQKAEMGMVLLGVEKELAKERQKEKFSPIDEKLSHGATAIGQVSKKIGLSEKTFERAKKVIEEGPEKLKALVRKEAVSIAGAYGVTKALKDVPAESKTSLMEELEKGKLEPRELIRVVASTNAVKAQLEGEEELVKQTAEELFKDQYYTKELDSKEAIWQIEEIAGDPHHLITREFPLEQFTSFEEAQKWAVERDGVCLNKIEKWLIKYDPVKAKKLEEAEKVESES